MLGALGELAGVGERDVRQLRQSLNPLSRFDYYVTEVLRIVATTSGVGGCVGSHPACYSGSDDVSSVPFCSERNLG